MPSLTALDSEFRIGFIGPTSRWRQGARSPEGLGEDSPLLPLEYGDFGPLKYWSHHLHLSASVGHRLLFRVPDILCLSVVRMPVMEFSSPLKPSQYTRKDHFPNRTVFQCFGDCDRHLCSKHN